MHEAEKTDKIALAGGILAIAGWFVPLIGFMPFIAGWFVPLIGLLAVIAGVVMCVRALKRGTKREKLARGSLIFSGVMFLLFLILVILLIGAIFGFFNNLNNLF